MISTATLSFDRWDIALSRLGKYIESQQQTLKQTLTPVRVDLSTRELLLPRAQADHAKVFELIATLDSALILQMQIKSRYQRAEVAFDLPEIEGQIQGLRNLSELFDVITDAPSRLEVLHEMEYAHKRFEALRLAGEGDLIRAERQHLKSLTFELPAVGHEDFVPLNEYHERINAQLDALLAQRKEIRARSGFKFEADDEHHGLLVKIGLATYLQHQSESDQKAPKTTEAVLAKPQEKAQASSAASETGATAGHKISTNDKDTLDFAEKNDSLHAVPEGMRATDDPLSAHQAAQQETDVGTASAWDAVPQSREPSPDQRAKYAN